jgi:hypothetical protein
MLTRWSLKNVKAFGTKVDLSLAPLTLFMGANSSGKSTILQTLLLVKQTLQYAAANKPLALNGPLIRLGDFTDVLSNSAKDRSISLGWTLEVDYLSSGADGGPLSPSYVPSFSMYTVGEVSVELTFGSAESSGHQPRSSVDVSLNEAQFQTEYNDGDTKQTFEVQILESEATSSDEPIQLQQARPAVTWLGARTLQKVASVLG